MDPNLIKYGMAFIYLAVDITYVVLSRGYYNEVVKKIQGAPMNIKRDSYIVAIISYAILTIGWIVLVANRLSAKSNWDELLPTAVMYGLAVYGVFNATLYVMFKNWDYAVSIRDTLWGVSWITVSAAIYLYLLKMYKK
jgi:uncharacterized membrane protein